MRRRVPLLPLFMLLAACLSLAACTKAPDGSAGDAAAGRDGARGGQGAGGPGGGGPGGGGPGGGGPGGRGGGGPALVVAVAVEARALGTDIEAVGTANANESVDVSAKIANRVTAIRFSEGQRVRRGDVLAELDDAEVKAELAEAEAVRFDSERQLRRGRELAEKKALPVSQLEQLEAKLLGDRARVAAAQARLAETVIRASFDGRVGFRRVSVGSLVNAGTVITTLDDTSVIKLDFTVPETLIYLIEEGQAVRATTAGLPGVVFEGKVVQLDSRVDVSTRSIVVRALLPNADGRLRPGMYMTVSLRGKVVPTLLLPEGAIVPEQGRMYVFLVRGTGDDAVAERREVRLGRRQPGEVEILAGVRAGDRVVVEGTQNVRDGAKVRIARGGAGGS